LQFFSEILYEDQNFSQRKLAALVASKVYFHLGSFDDSLTYALGAEELFDTNSRSEYVDTIISESGVSHYNFGLGQTAYKLMFIYE
jgi:26S proteasome regulatory subunit N2